MWFVCLTSGCWRRAVPHTGFFHVTDAGLEVFSAALRSSTTITAVTLYGKYKWLVCLANRNFLCMQLDVRSVGGCGVVCLGVVWCACVEIARRVDVGAGPHQQVARTCELSGWRSSWGLVLIAGTHTHTHTHTGFEVTDAGFKAVSAALGSSTSITSVELAGKYAWLVTLL